MLYIIVFVHNLLPCAGCRCGVAIKRNTSAFQPSLNSMIATSNYFVSHLKILGVMGNVKMDSTSVADCPPDRSLLSKTLLHDRLLFPPPPQFPGKCHQQQQLHTAQHLTPLGVMGNVKKNSTSVADCPPDHSLLSKTLLHDRLQFPPPPQFPGMCHQQQQLYTAQHLAPCRQVWQQ